jgi:hypothetical protein
MLPKLGELHQSLCPCATRNPSAAWGSTCLDGPCEQGPNVVLEATVLRQESPETMCVLLYHDRRSPRGHWSSLESCGSTLTKDGTPQETFSG